VAPKSPWAHYDRAVALHHLGHTEAAVEEYRMAEARFGDRAQWGKSIAIYGRARALDDAGRCVEAGQAYGEFAAFVRSSDPAAAAMAKKYAEKCQPVQTPAGDTVASTVTGYIIGRDLNRALTVAEDALRSQEKPNPWVAYNRAVALAGLLRSDEAADAYLLAENAFAASHEPEAARGRAISIYGRARALDNGRRCKDARKEYERYAALVRPTDPAGAEIALRIARDCRQTNR
jgi:tetratricopeptide (TPR) repeat protein